MKDIPAEMAQKGLRLLRQIEQEISRNDFGDYLTALLIVSALLIAVVFLRSVILRILTRWVHKTSRHVVDGGLIIRTVSALFRFLCVLPFYLGLRSLSFSPAFAHILNILFSLIFVWYALTFLTNLARLVLGAVLNTQQHHAGTKALFPIVNVVIWILGLAFLLSNLGFNITGLVAGLGVVGIAVGLAAQTVLTDFLGYLVILLDHPFNIGDRVSIGGVSGVVERVGLRTTQLRSDSKELIYYPNGDLSKQILRNYFFQKEYVRVFQFGIVYETPLEMVRIVPDLVRQAVEPLAGVTLQRAHFISFGDSALIFEAAIAIQTSDANAAIDAQQAVNLGIMGLLGQHNIAFACPVTMIRLADRADAEKQNRNLPAEESVS